MNTSSMSQAYRQIYPFARQHLVASQQAKMCGPHSLLAVSSRQILVHQNHLFRKTCATNFRESHFASRSKLASNSGASKSLIPEDMRNKFSRVTFRASGPNISVK